MFCNFDIQLLSALRISWLPKKLITKYLKSELTASKYIASFYISRLFVTNEIDSRRRQIIGTQQQQRYV